MPHQKYRYPSLIQRLSLLVVMAKFFTARILNISRYLSSAFFSEGKWKKMDSITYVNPYIDAISVGRSQVENQIIFIYTRHLRIILLWGGEQAPLWPVGWRRSRATAHGSSRFSSSWVCRPRGSSPSSLPAVDLKLWRGLSVPCFAFTGEQSLFLAAPCVIWLFKSPYLQHAFRKSDCRQQSLHKHHKKDCFTRLLWIANH